MIESLTGLRSGVAEAMVLLSKEALIGREDARAALLTLLRAIKSTGAPEVPVSELRKWVMRSTAVKQWEAWRP